MHPKENGALSLLSAPSPDSPWDRRVWLLVVLAALVRLGVGLTLFWMAGQGGDPYPTRPLSQMLSAPDAFSYHIWGEEVMEYWQNEYPLLGRGDDGQWVPRFPILLGSLYYIFGAGSLVMLLANTLLSVGLGLLAYRLARALGQPPGRAAALTVLVCLWPSSLAWSSLPMKETLCLTVELLFLYQMLKLSLRPPGSPRGWVVEGAGLFFCLGLLSYIRFYMGYLLGLTGLACLGAGLLPWAEARVAWGARAKAAAMLLGAFLLFLPLYHEYPLFFYQGDLLPTAKPVGDRSPRSEPRAQERSLASSMGGGVVDRLVDHRRVFSQHGGTSLAPEASQEGDYEIWTGPHLIWRVVRDFLFFPYPWQRWPAGEHWTKVNLLVAAQMALWYLLMPGIAWGLVSALRRHPVAGVTLAAWALGLGLVLAYVVLNRGTLFRLRDQAMLPLMLFFDPAPYLLLLPARLRPR